MCGKLLDQRFDENSLVRGKVLNGGGQIGVGAGCAGSELFPIRFLNSLSSRSTSYNVVVLHNPVAAIHGVGFVPHDLSPGHGIDSTPPHQTMGCASQVMKVKIRIGGPTVREGKILIGHPRKNLD